MKKIISNIILIIYGLLIIFFILLFQGRTLLSLTWTIEMAKITCVNTVTSYTNIHYEKIIKTSYYVNIYYLFNNEEYKNTYIKTSKLYNMEEFLLVRINPKNPKEVIINQPAWTKLVLFFLVSIILISIGIVNIVKAIKTACIQN